MDHVFDSQIEDHGERTRSRDGLLDGPVAHVHAGIDVERGVGEAGEPQIVLDSRGETFHPRNRAAAQLRRQENVAVSVAKSRIADVERRRQLGLVAGVAGGGPDVVLAVPDPPAEGDDVRASFATPWAHVGERIRPRGAGGSQRRDRYQRRRDEGVSAALQSQFT